MNKQHLIARFNLLEFLLEILDLSKPHAVDRKNLIGSSQNARVILQINNHFLVWIFYQSSGAKNAVKFSSFQMLK